MITTSIVIPVFNKWELTSDCLRSLAQHTAGEDFAVVVADNASTDETPQACPALGAALFGNRFHYLRLERNRNFGPACNAGAAVVRSEFLLFLNNDTLATDNWLPPLLEAMRNDDSLAGVGPLLLYPDGTVQHLGIAIAPAGECIWHLYKNLPAEHPLVQRRRRFSAITGAALLVPYRLFHRVGGFFPNYANGFEDVDLGFTLTRSGSAMSVIPESRVIHLESQTPARNAHDLANSRLMRRRWSIPVFANFEALLEADGYEVGVDANLQVFPLVPKTRQRDMLRRLSDGPSSFNERLCREFLEQDPFWETGYVLLANTMERQGRFDEAIDVLRRCVTVLPTLETAVTMLHLLQKRNYPWEDLDRSITKWKNTILDVEPYTQKLELLCSILRRLGRDSLVPAYEEAGRKAEIWRQKWLAEQA